MSKNQEDSASEPRRGLSRRSFLQTAGVVTAAAAATPFSPLSAGSAMAKSVLGLGEPFRVGLLVQRGSWTTESMMNGISLHLSQIENKIAGRPVQLVVEEYKSAYSLQQKTAKLVGDAKVNVVIAAANARVADHVRNYIESKQVTFVEMNAGEVITAKMPTTPNYFRSTLNLWQAHAAMGSWAASTLGKKALVMSSFMNSGYDFHLAFSLGFEMEGGSVVATRITGAPSTSDHAGSVMPEVEKTSADLIYASYSDSQAYGFVQAYRSSGASAPVLGTDFRESSTGMRPDAAMSGSRFAGSWSPALQNDANRDFMKAYRDFTGKDADEYAVLGNDTIRMVLEAAKSSGNLSASLLNVGLNGPRDEMRFDPTTQTLGTPIYVFDAAAGSAPTQLDYAASTRAAAKMPTDAVNSGWTNSYLVG